MSNIEHDLRKLTPRKCDCKSQFCTGEDVRQIQMIWRQGNQSFRGALRNWCKGCRELNNGGFRYP